jgi:hypothetical protein
MSYMSEQTRYMGMPSGTCMVCPRMCAIMLRHGPICCMCDSPPNHPTSMVPKAPHHADGTCSTPQGAASCAPHQSTHPSLHPVTLRSAHSAQRVCTHSHATHMHMMPLFSVPHPSRSRGLSDDIHAPQVTQVPPPPRQTPADSVLCAVWSELRAPHNRTLACLVHLCCCGRANTPLHDAAPAGLRHRTRTHIYHTTHAHANTGVHTMVCSPAVMCCKSLVSMLPACLPACWQRGLNKYPPCPQMPTSLCHIPAVKSPGVRIVTAVCGPW